MSNYSTNGHEIRFTTLLTDFNTLTPLIRLTPYRAFSEIVLGLDLQVYNENDVFVCMERKVKHWIFISYIQAASRIDF